MLIFTCENNNTSGDVLEELSNGMVKVRVKKYGDKEIKEYVTFYYRDYIDTFFDVKLPPLIDHSLDERSKTKIQDLYEFKKKHNRYKHGHARSLYETLLSIWHDVDRYELARMALNMLSNVECRIVLGRGVQTTHKGVKIRTIEDAKKVCTTPQDWVVLREKLPYTGYMFFSLSEEEFEQFLSVVCIVYQGLRLRNSYSEVFISYKDYDNVISEIKFHPPIRTSTTIFPGSELYLEAETKWKSNFV